MHVHVHVHVRMLMRMHMHMHTHMHVLMHTPCTCRKVQAGVLAVVTLANCSAHRLLQPGLGVSHPAHHA